MSKKGILEFDLSDPDTKTAYLRALKSTNLALCLWDMKQYFRNRLKNITEDPTELTKAQSEFFDILDNYYINLDELIN